MRKQNTGFSLVELMVAMVITVILVLLISQVTSVVLQSWIKGRGNIVRNMDARTALELMAQDLQSAVIRPAPYKRLNFVWMAKAVDVNVKSSATSDLLPSYLAQNVAWLMFYGVPIDQGGDLCAMSYRLGYEDPIKLSGGSSVKLFGLYRTVISGSDTYNQALGMDTGASSPTQGQLQTLLTYWRGQSSDSTRNPDNFLIPHVIDFQVIFRAKNPDGTLIEIPQTTAIAISDKIQGLDANLNLLSNLQPQLSQLQDGARIDAVDVSIKLINEDVVKKIRQASTDTIDRLILQNNQTYTRRIQLNFIVE